MRTCLELKRFWATNGEVLTITTSGRAPGCVRSDRMYLTSLESCWNTSTCPPSVPNWAIVLPGGTYCSSHLRANTRPSVRETIRLKLSTDCADGHERQTIVKATNAGFPCARPIRTPTHSAASITAYAAVKHRNGITGIMYLAKTV